MQKKLTPEITARFADHAARWIEVGLSTAPADFDRAEDAVRKIYDATGLKQPLIVLRMGSPYGAIMGGYMAWAMLDGLNVAGEQQVGQQVRQQVERQVERQVWQQVEQQVGQQVERQVRQQVEQQVGQQVRQQVERQVWQQVWQQVGQQVERQVWQQVGQQVEQQVWQQVRQQVEQQVWQQVWQQVEQQVEQQVWQQVWQQVEQQVWLGKIQKKYSLSAYDYRGANLWASWHSYVTFLIENGFLDGTTKAATDYLLDRELAESCGLVWYSSAVAAISDRPETLRRDDEGRLHCENGPALAYRDGWALHAWHGTVVPAHWIENRASVDPVEVLKAENVEQRSAGMAILGSRMIPLLIEQNRAQFIDDSGSPDIGRLLEVKLPDLPQPGLYLVAECPRNGTIMEGVPPVSDIDGMPIRTALHAQAWRIGDALSEYQHPPVRT